MNSKDLKCNFIIIFVMLCTIVFMATWSIKSQNIVALGSDSTYFVGSDSNVTHVQKETAITYNPNDPANPSSGGAPCLTVLVPGIGEDASAWSGSFVGGGYGYNPSSLPEQIRETFNNIKVFTTDFNTTATAYSVEEQTKEYYNNEFDKMEGISSFSNDIITYHSVVMIQFSDVDIAQIQAYAELELVVNDLLYEYKYWGAPNPTLI